MSDIILTNDDHDSFHSDESFMALDKEIDKGKDYFMTLEQELQKISAFAK